MKYLTGLFGVAFFASGQAGQEKKTFGAEGQQSKSPERGNAMFQQFWGKAFSGNGKDMKRERKREREYARMK